MAVPFLSEKIVEIFKMLCYNTRNSVRCTIFETFLAVSYICLKNHKEVSYDEVF